MEVKVAAGQLQRWDWISGAPGFWDNAVHEYVKIFPQGSIIGTYATYPAKQYLKSKPSTAKTQTSVLRNTMWAGNKTTFAFPPSTG